MDPRRRPAHRGAQAEAAGHRAPAPRPNRGALCAGGSRLIDWLIEQRRLGKRAENVWKIVEKTLYFLTYLIGILENKKWKKKVFCLFPHKTEDIFEKSIFDHLRFMDELFEIIKSWLL